MKNIISAQFDIIYFGIRHNFIYRYFRKKDKLWVSKNGFYSRYILIKYLSKCNLQKFVS
jgi:hypothetical protein